MPRRHNDPAEDASCSTTASSSTTSPSNEGSRRADVLLSQSRPADFSVLPEDYRPIAHARAFDYYAKNGGLPVSPMHMIDQETLSDLMEAGELSSSALHFGEERKYVVSIQQSVISINDLCVGVVEGGRAVAGALVEVEMIAGKLYATLLTGEPLDPGSLRLTLDYEGLAGPPLFDQDCYVIDARRQRIIEDMHVTPVDRTKITTNGRVIQIDFVTNILYIESVNKSIACKIVTARADEVFCLRESEETNRKEDSHFLKQLEKFGKLTIDGVSELSNRLKKEKEFRKLTDQPLTKDFLLKNEDINRMHKRTIGCAMALLRHVSVSNAEPIGVMAHDYGTKVLVRCFELMPSMLGELTDTNFGQDKLLVELREKLEMKMNLEEEHSRSSTPKNVGSPSAAEGQKITVPAQTLTTTPPSTSARPQQKTHVSSIVLEVKQNQFPKPVSDAEVKGSQAKGTEKNPEPVQVIIDHEDSDSGNDDPMETDAGSRDGDEESIPSPTKSSVFSSRKQITIEESFAKMAAKMPPLFEEKELEAPQQLGQMRRSPSIEIINQKEDEGSPPESAETQRLPLSQQLTEQAESLQMPTGKTLSAIEQLILKETLPGLKRKLQAALPKASDFKKFVVSEQATTQTRKRNVDDGVRIRREPEFQEIHRYFDSFPFGLFTKCEEHDLEVGELFYSNNQMRAEDAHQLISIARDRYTGLFFVWLKRFVDGVNVYGRAEDLIPVEYTIDEVTFPDSYNKRVYCGDTAIYSTFTQPAGKEVVVLSVYRKRAVVAVALETDNVAFLCCEVSSLTLKQCGPPDGHRQTHMPYLEPARFCEKTVALVRELEESQTKQN